ncbi:beta-propeller fold lactonase family protein [Cellvibrio sp. PSBB023]|uniref:lactonase family protein n=1 Tax=Cellvibrio sp. PSBB023 TaxID=1945512 RepID=UPI00143B58C9|nr:beta-propeller fold lactonase family protein [Cellvibrio sp. PSBB023]
MAGVSCYATSVIYVANADAKKISVFTLSESSGLVNLLQTLPVDGAIMPMALAPNKKILYAAIRSIPYHLVVLDVDPTSGRLALRAKVPLVDNMANISIDHSGHYLFAASYSGNSISVHTLDTQGIPLPNVQVLSTGSHPHQISAGPDNQFVYVSLLGDDRVDYFRLNSEESITDVLQPILTPAVTLPSGSGPRHFVFSAKGNFLYVLNELSGYVQVYARRATDGSLAFVEHHQLMNGVKPWAADIHLTPQGDFLYASERATSRLYGYRINSKNGRLNPIGSWETEAQPRAFTISPDGRFLVVAGQLSHRISIYAIHPLTGALQLLSSHKTGKNPAWVNMVNLSSSDH